MCIYDVSLNPCWN